MTWLMRCTSKPRAATSVATTILILPTAQIIENAFALLLSDVAVQSHRAMTVMIEVFGQGFSAALGLDEDNDAIGLFGFE